MSKEIKSAVTPEERDRLDIEAAAHGVSRAQLVRDRALNAGIIPRVQMEPEAQERAVRNLQRTLRDALGHRSIGLRQGVEHHCRERMFRGITLALLKALMVKQKIRVVHMP